MLVSREHDGSERKEKVSREGSSFFKTQLLNSCFFFLSFRSSFQLFLPLFSSCMAVPRAMARPLGPRMFALPVGGKENQGGAARDKTLFGDVDDGENNAPSTSSPVPPEWALVELQGEVQPPAGAGPEDSFTAGRLVLKVRRQIEAGKRIVHQHLSTTTPSRFFETQP